MHGTDFKTLILKKCDERADFQSDEVRIRVLGASSDIYAAHAQYHHDCYLSFMPTHNVHAAHGKVVKESCTLDSRFKHLFQLMVEKPNHIWTSIELYNKYVHLCEGRDTVHCRQLISNVLCHFGDDLVKLDISGCASLLFFKDHLPSCIRIEKVEDDEEAMITKMTDTIMAECKALPKLGYEVGKFTQSEAIKSTSHTLLTLVSSLASCGKTSRASLTLAQAIQSHITKSFNQTTLGLAIKLHHRFGSKELISLLHQHGLTATYYEEILRFRTSAAVYTPSIHTHLEA